MGESENNKNIIKIEASVACANFRNLEKDIKELEKCKIDFLHIDIMDGTFVPNFALSFSIMKAIHEMTTIPIECHLMIQKPERYIEIAAKSGAEYISIHAEATNHIQRVLSQIRETGVKSGIAINPATPINVLDYILGDLDMIVIMTVNPGFAGQPLIPATLKKIEDVRKLIDSKGFGDIEIQVDGNVSMVNIPKMIKCGATMLVGGTSSVFREGHTIADSVKTIKELIK
jgi:ribulose-phosphate 3-epimerase